MSNRVNSLVPLEIAAGIVIAVLTCIVLVVGAIFSIGTASRYLKMKSM